MHMRSPLLFATLLRPFACCSSIGWGELAFDLHFRETVARIKSLHGTCVSCRATGSTHCCDLQMFYICHKSHLSCQKNATLGLTTKRHTIRHCEKQWKRTGIKIHMYTCQAHEGEVAVLVAILAWAFCDHSLYCTVGMNGTLALQMPHNWSKM